MLLLGPSSEAEMVLAFLRAEVESPSWILGGVPRQLLEAPDTSDDAQNQERARLLGTWRGFNEDRLLFARFPDDVIWRRYSFKVSELANFKYVDKVPSWNSLSAGQRLVGVGASRVDGFPGGIKDGPFNRDIIAGIKAVARLVDHRKQFEDLIGASNNERSQNIVLIEGHTRATAYLQSATTRSSRADSVSAS